MALEATLFRIYDQLVSGAASSPALAEAQNLYDEGHCLQAEYRLRQMLKHEPENLTAGLMLMKLYAENLRDRNRALALLRAFEQGRAVPYGFIEYARQRINEWFDPATVRLKSPEGIESILVQRKQVEEPEEDMHPQFSSIADLLKSGRLGTAIERLETDIKKRPHDFDSRLQLAEAYGRYCCNFTRAREIVAKMETNPAFSTEQVRRAKAKLQEWRTRRPNSQVTS
jgi:thioredoxin-like negative regulator of GroEL